MKKYEVVGQINSSILDDVEENCLDIKKYKKIEDDFMTNITATVAFAGSGIGYKDLLLYKEAFKKGYLAAHVVGDWYDSPTIADTVITRKLHPNLKDNGEGRLILEEDK